jgi:hypothetical protein
VSIIPDSDVCMTQDENYSIGASFWLQVSKTFISSTMGHAVA